MIPEPRTLSPESLPKRHGWLKQLTLVVASLVAAMVAAEVLVRLLVPVRNVGPSFTTYDPVYGKRLKSSSRCWRYTPEFVMRLTTNSLGFRGPTRTTPPKETIVFVGDSFTMGYGVTDGQEYPVLIAEKLAEQYGLNHVGVVNADMDANGNGRWIKFLRDEAKQYNPRVVVLQIAGNDFIENVGENLFGLSPCGGLIEYPVPGSSSARRAQLVIEAIPGLAYSHLVGLLRQARGGSLFHGAGSNPPDPRMLVRSAADQKSFSDAEELTFVLVERSLSICHEQGWPVIVIAVEVPGRRLSELYKRCETFDGPVIAVPTKRERPKLYHKIDGHWNAEGHRFVAALLVDRLQPLVQAHQSRSQTTQESTRQGSVGTTKHDAI